MSVNTKPCPKREKEKGDNTKSGDLDKRIKRNTTTFQNIYGINKVRTRFFNFCPYVSNEKSE